MGLHLLDGLAAIDDLAVLGPQQARNCMHGGGFARAVCTDQRHDLALVYMKRDVLDGVDRTVIYVNVLDRKHFSHGQSPPR